MHVSFEEISKQLETDLDKLNALVYKWEEEDNSYEMTKYSSEEEMQEIQRLRQEKYKKLRIKMLAPLLSKEFIGDIVKERVNSDDEAKPQYNEVIKIDGFVDKIRYENYKYIIEKVILYDEKNLLKYNKSREENSGAIRLFDYIKKRIRDYKDIDSLALEWYQLKRDNQDTKKKADEIFNELLSKHSISEDRYKTFHYAAGSSYIKCHIFGGYQVLESVYIDVLLNILNVNHKVSYDASKGMTFLNYFREKLKQSMNTCYEQNMSPLYTDGITGSPSYYVHKETGEKLKSVKDVPKKRKKEYEKKYEASVERIAVNSENDSAEQEYNLLKSKNWLPEEEIVNDIKDGEMILLHTYVISKLLNLNNYVAYKNMNTDKIDEYIEKKPIKVEGKILSGKNLKNSVKVIFQLILTYQIIDETEKEKREEIYSRILSSLLIQHNDQFFPLMLLGFVDMLKEGNLEDYKNMRIIIKHPLRQGINIKQRLELMEIYTRIINEDNCNCRQTISKYAKQFAGCYEYTQKMWKEMQYENLFHNH